jgi:hypothetical protein
VGENPDLADWQHSSETAVDPATWRLLKLHVEQRWGDGTLDTIEVETLQPPSWIAEHQAREGSLVPMPVDAAEMGMPAGLRATVVSIDPCPEIADGPGHVVTTTINHLNSFICQLVVTDALGRRETIKTTGFHKFYSDTRRGWVSASELRDGERLRGVGNPLRVAGVERVPGVERVYNFSVEGEHVYHVSVLGALVHNPGCGLKFGDPGYGTEVHQNFPDEFIAQTGQNPGDWQFNVGPGQTGPDGVWTGAAGGTNPGFNNVELKPATESGWDTFMKQLEYWTDNGTVQPGETSLWGYDSSGNIFPTQGPNF